MFTRITNSKLFARLKDKKYRNQFVAGEVRRTIPFQLRALRAERKWTQADLGKEAEMPQTVISRIENGDAASLSIKTLLKLASALDVALVVRFEPIDRLINWVDGLSAEAMTPRCSAEIIAEAETANEPRTSISLAASSNATPRLRAMTSQSVATAAVQRTLGFSSTRLVESQPTTATSLAAPATTPSAYQATA